MILVIKPANIELRVIKMISVRQRRSIATINMNITQQTTPIVLHKKIKTDESI